MKWSYLKTFVNIIIVPIITAIKPITEKTAVPHPKTVASKPNRVKSTPNAADNINNPPAAPNHKNPLSALALIFPISPSAGAKSNAIPR